MLQRANVLKHPLENSETVECVSQFAMLLRVCNRQSSQSLVDSLLSHVDARWQLVPVEFHCRRSIHVEPIAVIIIYGSPSLTDSPRTGHFHVEESACSVKAKKYHAAALSSIQRQMAIKSATSTTAVAA